MLDATKRGLWIGAAALTLGLLGDGLLRVGPFGLSGSLWIGAVVAALLWLTRQSGQPLSPATRWLAIGAGVISLGFAWRDAETLLVFDTLAMLICFGLAAAYSRGQDLRRGGVFDYAAGAAGAYIYGIAAPFLLLGSDIDWKTMPRSRWSGRAGAVVRGLLIAVPLLLIFGALFVSADAVFANLAGGLWSVDAETFLSHLLLASFLAVVAGAFLRTTLAAAVPDVSAIKRPVSWALGSVEMAITLGLLNALFLAFVLVQFRYFFGGAAHVEATTGLTYAEYARKGFFELVTVAAMVLPLLLAGHWLLPQENPKQEKAFRWLAGALVAQLAVIMTSAVQRMLLYVGEYGLTEQRLYATAFMGWLAVLFVWFIATVLRGQRNRFAFGALVTGLAMLVGLHVLNPDAFIVRTNLDRMAAGKRFDAAYNARLHADALPLLVDAFPGLSAEDQATVLTTLKDRGLMADAQSDWRTWNLARSKATAALQKLPR
ncbi:MAG TPA: DUF4173 domain-containing protein [Symbiobacteriaceae bacterium]|nr:DUF4173 domain-containing protein [Symbiobacteriaceae bacterium]